MCQKCDSDSVKCEVLAVVHFLRCKFAKITAVVLRPKLIGRSSCELRVIFHPGPRLIIVSLKVRE